MQIISEALQINISGEARIILIAQQLQLKSQCQIIFNIRIVQIINRTIFLRAAQTIKKHKTSHGLAIDLRHQMSIFIDSVPVQVDHCLNRRIFFQNLADLLLCPAVCLISVQFPIHQIIDTGHMHHFKALLPQELRQILPGSHNGGGIIPRHGIHKTFLGMGVIDQNLRTIHITVNGHIHIQQLFRMKLCR